MSILTCDALLTKVFFDTPFYLQHNLAWCFTYFVLPKKNLYMNDAFLNRALRIIQRNIVFVFLTILLSTAILNEPIPLEPFTYFVGFILFFRLIVYYTIHIIIRLARKHGKLLRRAIIIGYNETAVKLKATIENNPILGIQFVGFVEDRNSLQQSLGKIDNLAEIIREHQVDEVYRVLTPNQNLAKLNVFVNQITKLGVRVRVAIENEFPFRVQKGENHNGVRIIDPYEIPFDRIGVRFSKRLFDIIFSFLVIVLLLSWLIPIFGIIIKLQSKGPLFYIQKRTGINNRDFNCIKLRSMRVNSSPDIQARKDDSRITPFGKFMRKFNIDELPQFLNVFVGDMSVVGPRPHILSQTIDYSKKIAFYNSRHFIKPGITGWAQVNGFRGDTTEDWKMKKRVELDLEYITNWTFFKDFKIIFLTIFDRRAFLNAY